MWIQCIYSARVEPGSAKFRKSSKASIRRPASDSNGGKSLGQMYDAIEEVFSVDNVFIDLPEDAITCVNVSELHYKIDVSSSARIPFEDKINFYGSLDLSILSGLFKISAEGFYYSEKFQKVDKGVGSSQLTGTTKTCRVSLCNPNVRKHLNLLLLNESMFGTHVLTEITYGYQGAVNYTILDEQEKNNMEVGGALGFALDKQLSKIFDGTGKGAGNYTTGYNNSVVKRFFFEVRGSLKEIDLPSQPNQVDEFLNNFPEITNSSQTAQTYVFSSLSQLKLRCLSEANLRPYNLLYDIDRKLEIRVMDQMNLINNQSSNLRNLEEEFEPFKLCFDADILYDVKNSISSFVNNVTLVNLMLNMKVKETRSGDPPQALVDVLENITSIINLNNGYKNVLSRIDKQTSSLQALELFHQKGIHCFPSRKRLSLFLQDHSNKHVLLFIGYSETTNNTFSDSDTETWVKNWQVMQRFSNFESSLGFFINCNIHNYVSCQELVFKKSTIYWYRNGKKRSNDFAATVGNDEKNVLTIFGDEESAAKNKLIETMMKELAALENEITNAVLNRDITRAKFETDVVDSMFVDLLKVDLGLVYLNRLICLQGSLFCYMDTTCDKSSMLFERPNKTSEGSDYDFVGSYRCFELTAGGKDPAH